MGINRNNKIFLLKFILKKKTEGIKNKVIQSKLKAKKPI